MEVKKFVVGDGKFPEWFDEQALRGRAKINTDEFGELMGVTVFAPTKRMVAAVGDTVMLTRNGLMVVPKEKAGKYMPEKHKVM